MDGGYTAHSRPSSRTRDLKQYSGVTSESRDSGHMAAHAPQDLAAVNFSINYIKDYEKAVQASKTSADVIQIMQQQYPTLTENSNLELGAKVVKGEMKWP